MKKSKFFITHMDKVKIQVTGLTSKHFGIQKGATIITHLPTGAKIMMGLQSHKEAKKLVAMLEASDPPTPWSSGDMSELTKNFEITHKLIGDQRNE